MHPRRRFARRAGRGDARGMTTRAVVLGGGGVAGIAWEVGLIAGLGERGIDLAAADLVVGTSAGSVVGALLRGGVDLAAMLEAPDAADGRMAAPSFDVTAIVAAMGRALEGASGAQDARARLGAIALAAPTVPEAERREVIARRLPFSAWPPGRLLVTAVDAVTGEFLTFDADGPVGLVDAIAASCAVPGVWPPMTVDGRRLMDGGIRSITNADLAAGHDRVLVIAPYRVPFNPLGTAVDAEVAELARTGRALVVDADTEALQAFGSNPLDPVTRGPSALAGRRQAALIADDVRALWEG